MLFGVHISSKTKSTQLVNNNIIVILYVHGNSVNIIYYKLGSELPINQRLSYYIKYTVSILIVSSQFVFNYQAKSSIIVSNN